jgi:hypothetical protein
MWVRQLYREDYVFAHITIRSLILKLLVETRLLRSTTRYTLSYADRAARPMLAELTPEWAYRPMIGTMHCRIFDCNTK